MTLPHQINHAINRVLRHIGYKIVRTPEPHALEASLARSKDWIPRVGTVIDVGASNGSWSQIARQFYPDSAYLLIEANPAHESGLARFKAVSPGVDYVLAAAGSDDGEVYFDGRSLFGGAAATGSRDGFEVTPSVRIDTQVALRHLPPPYFIKLDTHGFEIPILEGAAAILDQTALLLIETYNFTIEPESLRFWEMCTYLEAWGFRPVDVVEPMRRPTDGALWQFDLLFIRSSHDIWRANRYE